MQKTGKDTRQAWIKAAAALAAAAVLVGGAIAGGGWTKAGTMPEEETSSAVEQQIEEGIWGPAEGSDAPSADHELFPESPTGSPFSDNPSETSSEDLSGMEAPSASRGNMAAALDAYLEDNFGATGLPGLAVVVVDAGGVDYENTLGDVTGHDTMLVGSLSKSFTALSIMQLAEAGKIDLDAPAAQYVPAYGTPEKVSVRMLLNQTSGFGYYDSLAQALPGITFGTFSYSNANYDLLGKIVEAVSGESYADYVAEHILEPLGMDDSSAGIEARAAAHAYRNYFGLPVADGFVHEDSDDSWGTVSSGYMATSIEDMAKYLIMYLNQGSASATGGAQILSATGIRQMFLSRVADPTSDTYYGMGWTSYYWSNGELVLSHDGDVENGVARMVIFPERGIAIAVMGDAADAFGGNAAFYELADGVIATVVGGKAEPVHGELRILAHAEEDGWLLLIGVLALAPLAKLRKWKRTAASLEPSAAASRLVAVHVLFPLALLGLPLAEGYQWRDVVTFTPDVAIVYLGSVCALVLAGAMKIVLLVRARHAQGARG